MARKKASTSEILKTARESLGFDSLRAGQEEAIAAVLEGHDTLVVQPTGSGKSAIYQIAGLMMDGGTLIVSPLIALQKDQADSIAGPEFRARCGAQFHPARLRNSRAPERVRRGRKSNIFFWRLSNSANRRRSKNLQGAEHIALRSRRGALYQRMGPRFPPRLPAPGPVIEALGPSPRAGAHGNRRAPRPRGNSRALDMRRPKIFVQGFDRPNIYLRVDVSRREAEKREALVHRVRWADKPGIIYTGTRKAAEEIMRALEAEQIEALFYHGGLKGQERHEIQERFMSGEAEVMVATNAFGMGVDKPDIRFVYHYDASDSLDSYYQEIGRAGRDGDKAEAVLFYRARGYRIAKFQDRRRETSNRRARSAADTNRRRRNRRRSE